jgi:hypothetical protein
MNNRLENVTSSVNFNGIISNYLFCRLAVLAQNIKFLSCIIGLSIKVEVYRRNLLIMYVNLNFRAAGAVVTNN